MQTTSTPDTQPHELHRQLRFVGNWGATLALLTTPLAIYGYCVMQGLADILHLEGGSLWGSPSDVLHYAFLGIVASLKLIPNRLSLDMIETVLTHPFYWLGTVILAVFVWAMCRTDASSDAIPKWVQCLRNKLQRSWLQRRIRKLAVYQWIMVAATPLAAPLAFILVWFSLVAVIALLILFGLPGIICGRSIVDDLGSTAYQCVASLRSPVDPSRRPVRCVRVRWHADGQSMSEAGILIASTSSYALLMDPETQRAQRVPLTGQAIMETVDTLRNAPPPAPLPSRTGTPAHPRSRP